MFSAYQPPPGRRLLRRGLWLVGIGVLLTAFEYFGTAEHRFFGLVRGLTLGILMISVGAGLTAVAIRTRR